MDSRAHPPWANSSPISSLMAVDGHSGDPRIPASDFRLSRCTENALLKSRYPGAAAGQMR
ncbi:hypothetical protein X011_08145 [Mycobacterium tuberculosis variant microti OV254]|nr:hypothetical protein X011_08145 [Mycobacterium tuberculosis variant microti OV254]